MALKLALSSHDRQGRRLATFPAASLESYGQRLNGIDHCEFTLPAVRLPDIADDLTVVNARNISDVLNPDAGHEVRVTSNSRVVFEGPLVAVDEGVDEVQFGAAGLGWYLAKMHVTTTLQTQDYPDADSDDPYSGPIAGATIISRDQHLIVKALVDHGQGKPGGDHRIDTDHVTASGTLRDRQYKGWETPNVLQAVENLAELTSVQGGCDWWIEPGTRRLRLATPRRGRRRANLVHNDRSVRAISRRKDKTVQETAVIGIGAGEGQDMLRIDRSDAAAVARVGRLEGVLARKDISRRSTLIDHADARLREHGSLPNLITVTVAVDEPDLHGYEVGDEGRIHYPSPYQRIDEFRRIVGIDVKPGGGAGGEDVAELHTIPVGVS